MLWEGGQSLLGRWVPVPAGGLSLAPLHCSRTVMMMSSSATHRAASIQTQPRALGTACPLPGWSSQHRDTGRGSVQDHRLSAAPSPVQSLLGDTCPGTHHPYGPSAGAHHQHIWLQSSQIKSNISPTSASSVRGAQASSHIPVGSPGPIPWSHIPCVQGGPLGDDAAALWAAGAAPAAATSPASPLLLALGWPVQGHGVEGGR